jgi:predicted nucleic acid-binding protein
MSDILDTNVLLRFLVGDHIKHQLQARKWFKEAEQGKRTIVVKPLVIAETCFVLESFYQHPRKVIADTLKVFLSQKWLKVNERPIMLDLWTHYTQGHHFVDSYLLAWIYHHQAGLLSFDQKLLKKSRRK